MTLRQSLAGIAAAMLFHLAAATAAEVGQKAPEFTLTDMHGEKHSLSDYAGKVVVLEWTNHGCPFVKKYYNSGSMQELQAKAKEQDVVWLTICSSAKGKQGNMSPDEWRKTAKEKGFNGAAMLLDEDGKVGRKYGAIATPHMYVIDSRGTLVYDGAIDSIPSAKAEDIAKAESYVMNAIEAVQKGQPVAKAKTKPYGCDIKYARES